MNVLLLNSSYRTDGNTALALDSLSVGLAERGIEGSASRAAKPSFAALIAFAIQKDFYLRHEDKSSVDRRYWSERGWLDSGRAFYAEGGIGAPKASVRRQTVPELVKERPR